MPRPLLMSPEDLASALAGPRPPVVLDVRWRLGGPPGEPEHAAGHVPSAAYVDLERALAAPARADRVGGRHPLPRPAVFGAAMRRAGVTANRAVVLYDDFDGLSAARGWWLLTHHGHVDVRLLDGGWPAWRAAGLAIESGPVRPAPGTWTPLTPGRRPLLDAAGAAALARVGVLLDARAPERYRGEVEPVDPVAGHVPGARNAPRTTWVGEDGRFLPPAAIAARAAALGVEPAGPVAAYCGSGITAAHTVFALALGGVDAALYAGSWSDWVSDPDRPVVTGVEP